MDTTRNAVQVVGWAALVIVVFPDLADAYVDPTAGGLLLQVVLGGATSIGLIGWILVRRLSERVLRRLRGSQ